jgi:hypothetical protein
VDGRWGGGKTDGIDYGEDRSDTRTDQQDEVTDELTDIRRFGRPR